MAREVERIFIDPFHVEAKFNSHDFSFTLIFWGKRSNGKSGKRVEVHIKFSFWWIRYLKSVIGDVVSLAQNEVDEARGE